MAVRCEDYDEAKRVKCMLTQLQSRGSYRVGPRGTAGAPAPPPVHHDDLYELQRRLGAAVSQENYLEAKRLHAAQQAQQQQPPQRQPPAPQPAAARGPPAGPGASALLTPHDAPPFDHSRQSPQPVVGAGRAEREEEERLRAAKEKEDAALQRALDKRRFAELQGKVAELRGGLDAATGRKLAAVGKEDFLAAKREKENVARVAAELATASAALDQLQRELSPSPSPPAGDAPRWAGSDGGTPEAVMLAPTLAAHPPTPEAVLLDSARLPAPPPPQQQGGERSPASKS
eukprot:gene37111-19285_t